MKSMIYQFYNEGFATTFVIKPIKLINKKIKSKRLIEFLSVAIKTLYTVLILAFAFVVAYIKIFK